MLKHSLLAAAISALLLTGCTSTNNQSNVATVAEPTRVTNIAAPIDFGSENITLEQAMADPDWIGRQPESASWNSDSKTVIFQQKRAGSVVRDSFSIDLVTGKTTKIDLANLHTIPGQDAVLSPDGSALVYTFSGNIFSKSIANGDVKQLTHSATALTLDKFLTNGLLSYNDGMTLYTLDLNSGISKSLARLNLKEAPKGVTEPSDYLSKNQLRLIKYIEVQHNNAKDKEQFNNELKDQNANVFDQDIYLGKGKRLVAFSLSPNAEKLVVALKEDKPSRAAHDIMPNYVAKDGSIEAKPARQRVAESKPSETELFVIDLKTGEQVKLDYSTLPGFDEDVLASVKAENAKAKGETYVSKKQPRHLNLMSNWEGSIQWSADGNNVALMLEAWDNKDRWIATLDKNNKLVSQHRLHDDAWVNYTFNEFGFLPNNNLYYLSEESGYSHLYTKPLNGKAKQLTKGRFEVSSLTISKDGSQAYFKANQKHPGIYEIYRVDLTTGEQQALTDLNGMTDYELSPDESTLLLQHSTLLLPTELYAVELNNTSDVKRLTYTVSNEFLNKKLIAPKVVAVKSSHTDQPIYSKVYYPADYVEGETGKKRKAVIFNHGAGYLQNSHLGWSGYFREFMFHSLLASEGYVVMDMDYRASKGYGRDWRTAIYRQMGTPETQDLVDGVNWMVENANVDKGAVGTYGGSYGGFMTFMALFTEPELFQAGAALRPVSDWAYYNHGYTSNILNTPDVDPIAFERSSPIFHAEGLNKPLLINAPMVDDNVFFQDVVRLVQRLIELEKTDFETAIYPVEPHGFVQPSSWLDEYRRIYKLFKENL